jgi:hypothetical protein
MRHIRLRITATIIGCIILAVFLLSAPHTREIVNKESSISIASTTPVVPLSDSYKKGVHTITGLITAPTVCTTLSVDASLIDRDSTPSILLTLSLPKDVGICLQRETSLRFSKTITAPANLPIITTVNGVVASTTAL